MTATIGPVRYARAGSYHIAYREIGAGPIDIVVSPGFMTHLEQNLELPDARSFLLGLGAFARVIVFDRRGTGLSDRLATTGSLEEALEDVTAVMDAVGSERAALLGQAEGSALCTLFAATYPSRVAQLILWNPIVCGTAAPGYPWAPSVEAWDRTAEAYAADWGIRPLSMRAMCPDTIDDPIYRRLYLRGQLFSASPGSALVWFAIFRAMDVRAVLEAIRVPTLVLQVAGNPAWPVDGGRHVADRIPGARFARLSGRDMLITSETVAREGVVEIQRFLTGSVGDLPEDRALVTLLFTDIGGSTELAARLGDRAWRRRLDRHDELMRAVIHDHRGREIKTWGDAFLAAFDGPARAVRCAQAMRAELEQERLAIRFGVHTGECEIRGDDLGGMALHVGARISALASPGEILVSSTVKELVVGSGLRFEDRGSHELKGVPDPWHVYEVVD